MADPASKVVQIARGAGITEGAQRVSQHFANLWLKGGSPRSSAEVAVVAMLETLEYGELGAFRYGPGVFNLSHQEYTLALADVFNSCFEREGLSGILRGLDDLMLDQRVHPSFSKAFARIATAIARLSLGITTDVALPSLLTEEIDARRRAALRG